MEKDAPRELTFSVQMTQGFTQLRQKNRSASASFRSVKIDLPIFCLAVNAIFASKNTPLQLADRINFYCMYILIRVPMWRGQNVRKISSMLDIITVKQDLCRLLKWLLMESVNLCTPHCQIFFRRNLITLPVYCDKDLFLHFFIFPLFIRLCSSVYYFLSTIQTLRTTAFSWFILISARILVNR